MKKTTYLKINLISFFVLFACAGFLPVLGQQGTLTITKEGLPERSPGDTISYRLTYFYSNNTNEHATNVVIKDHFPSGDVSYISSDPAGQWNPLTNTITWTKDQIPTLGSLNTGYGIIHIRGKVGKKFIGSNYYPDGYYLSDAANIYSFSNYATIESDQLKLVDDTDNSQRSDTVTTTVQQKCTFTISQASGIIKSASSSELMYIISINNTGNIWNKWSLSSIQGGTGYQNLVVSFSDLFGQPLSNNETEWVAPGSSTLFLMKLVSPIGTNPSIGTGHPDNLTTVTATPIACGAPSSRSFTTPICGGNCPDYQYVSTYKLDNPDPAQAGTELTYRVIIYNSQNKAVSNIKLVETYPLHTTFVSSTTPTNNGSPVTYTMTGNNEWFFASLPMGMTTFFITLKLNDNIVNNTIITNRLNLFTNTYNNDTIPFSFFEENTLVLSAHDLWIEKTADKSFAQAGEIVTFTLNYGNKGNYKGDNVEITDNYDEVYMDVYNAGGGTDVNGELIWTFPGIMPIGTTGTITYQLKIKDPLPTGTSAIFNTVNIANHQNPLVSNDRDFSNNQDIYAVFVVELPDLVVTKTADKTSIKPGENLVYTITVTNTGDSDHIGGFTLTDLLPAGVSYFSSSPAGIYNSTANTITWTTASNTTLAVGSSINFNVEISGISPLLGGTNLENNVSVTSSVQEKSLENNTFKYFTPVDQNLWYGGTSTDWSVAANWTHNVVPGIGENIVFATAANNGGNAAVSDLILDTDRVIGDLVNLSDRALRIPVIDKTVSPVNNKRLTVNGKATVNSADRIIVESKKEQAAGALIFTDPSQNSSVQASVQFASISKPGTGTWPRVWQFFGSPVLGERHTYAFGPNVQGSIYGGDPTVNTIIRKYEEYLNLIDNAQEKWNDVSVTDLIVAYQGYEITQPQTKFDNADASPYVFRGLLVTHGEYIHPFTISPSPTYSRGNYILANPYVAPIFIGNMTTSDFVNLDPTIYIYNTGSRQDWLDNSGANETQIGDKPGTYSSVPISIANTIGKTQIPSMQGFMVKALSDGASETSFRFRYATVDKGSLTFDNEPMRVRAVSKSSNMNLNAIYPLIKMDVLGENSSDRLYLVTAENTTKSYDPSWDGIKSIAPNLVQLFVTDADGRRLQVNTDSDLSDTYIGLVSGGESFYTLRFTFNEQMFGTYSSLFIEDLTSGDIREITDGMTMTVSATAGTVNKRFKLSTSRVPTRVHSDKISEALKLAVNQSDIVIGNSTNENVQVTVYNLVGQPVFTRKIAAGLQTVKHGLSKGTYVIEAKTAVTGEKTILKSIIN